MRPYLKEMFGHTLFCGANPPTPSVSSFSLLKNVTLSVVPKARMAMEYSSQTIFKIVPARQTSSLPLKSNYFQEQDAWLT